MAVREWKRYEKWYIKLFLCKKRPHRRRTEETLDSGERHLKCTTRFPLTTFFRSVLSSPLRIVFPIPSTWMSFVSLFFCYFQLPRSDVLSLQIYVYIGHRHSEFSPVFPSTKQVREQKNPRTPAIRSDRSRSVHDSTCSFGTRYEAIFFPRVHKNSWKDLSKLLFNFDTVAHLPTPPHKVRGTLHRVHLLSRQRFFCYFLSFNFFFFFLLLLVFRW